MAAGYFRGLGWVDFNPTPTRPLVARAQDDSEFQTAEEAALAEEEGEAVLSLLDDFEVDPFSGSAGPILLPDEQNGILGAGIASIFATLATLVVVLGIAAILAAVGARVWWEYRFRRLLPTWRAGTKLLVSRGLGGRGSAIDAHTPRGGA